MLWKGFVISSPPQNPGRFLQKFETQEPIEHDTFATLIALWSVHICFLLQGWNQWRRKTIGLRLIAQEGWPEIKELLTELSNAAIWLVAQEAWPGCKGLFREVSNAAMHHHRWLQLGSLLVAEKKDSRPIANNGYLEWRDVSLVDQIQVNCLFLFFASSTFSM